MWLGIVQGAVSSYLPPSLRPRYWPGTTNDKRNAGWAGKDAVDDVGIQGAGKRVMLVKRPSGAIQDDDFKTVDEPVPEKAPEGTCVVRLIYLSMDPTHRIWMQDDVPQYMPSVGLGTVMRTSGVGQIVATDDPREGKVGDYVSGVFGVQEYAIVKLSGSASYLNRACNPVVPGVPLQQNLSLFSVISLTAWVGINICECKEKETLVVSGAAGAVGGIAVQLAKLRYPSLRVVGIAGTPEKCQWLTDVCKIDAVINYKTDDVPQKLKDVCPNGIDAYFDNVGGSTLEAVLLQMNTFGRIAYCGSISSYNSGISFPVTNYHMILMRRLKIQGFICADHLADFGLCIGELLAYHRAGKIHVKEDIDERSVDQYPAVVRKLYSGLNDGKLIMKIAPEVLDSSSN